MEQEKLDKLKYPIGHHVKPDLKEWVSMDFWKNSIETLPTVLAELTNNLTEKELTYHYRPQGWNIKQVVHHLADSHMNCFIRFKLALTEDNPTIKPYEEALWAEMEDASTIPIEFSLAIIQGVHGRWAHLLSSMSESDFNKSFLHPENNSSMSLFYATSLYSWHSNHHAEHIRNAIEHQFKQ